MHTEMRWRLAAGLAPACLASYLVWRATASGLWFSPDGSFYLDAANSLASTGRPWIHDACGRKLWMNTFPPLFPMVAGLGIAAGVDAFVFVRLLNTLCAALSAGLLACTVGAAAGSLRAGMLAGALLAVLPDFVEAHRSFLSEPLYFALLAGAFLLIESGLRTNSTRKLLAAAALLGLGAATRYAGTPLLIAVPCCVWAATRRARVAVALLLTAVAPLALILAANAHFATAATDRQLAFTAFDPGYLTHGLAVAAAWLRLGWLPPVLQAVTCGALLAGLTVLCWRRGWRRRISISWVALLCAAAYLMFVLAMRLYVDSAIELEPRQTLPLFPLLTIAFGATVSRRWLVGSLLLLLAMQSGGALRQPPVRGVKANSNDPAWRNSSTLGYAAQLQGIVCRYANAPDVVYRQIGKPATWLPRSQRDYTRWSDPEWCRETKAMLGKSGPAAFIFLDRFGERYNAQVTEAELAQCLETAGRVRLDDGTVLTVR